MPRMRCTATPYLHALANALHQGCTALSADEIALHCAAVLRFRSDDGGFRGRRGGAELYYTTFALRCLAALGRLAAIDRAALRRRLGDERVTTIIDALSLLECRRMIGDPAPAADTLALVERLRHPGGGYCKTPRGTPSLYHSFLAALCYNLAGQSQPMPDALAAFVRSRQADDGGFGETGIATRSSTNATAAALAALELLGASHGAATDAAHRFLCAAQHRSGGWLAVCDAPVPDLLSSFTALLSLRGSGLLPGERIRQARDFALACRRQDGGFTAGPWDTDSDVEYTYYGLGVLMLTLRPTRTCAWRQVAS